MELRADLTSERIGMGADGIQAAAFGRTVGAERADDDVAAALDRPDDLLYADGSLLDLRQEMKDRANVPDIISLAIRAASRRRKSSERDRPAGPSASWWRRWRPRKYPEPKRS